MRQRMENGISAKWAGKTAYSQYSRLQLLYKKRKTGLKSHFKSAFENDTLINTIILTPVPWHTCCMRKSLWLLKP